MSITSPPQPFGQLLDRAQGLVLGQLVGDALGAQVKFQSSAEIARRHPDGVRTSHDGGPFNPLAGQPADDSEIALARTLVQTGRFEVPKLARAYADRYRSEPFDIGNTVRRACSAGARALDRGLDVAEAMRSAANPDSQAKGAMMRISPLAILEHRDLERVVQIAMEDARLTHPNPVCLAANAAFVAALFEGLDGRGGDTDTNGAIAGALLGAAHGAGRVPPSGLAPDRAELPCCGRQS